ncbi:HAMP domain-containing sensor histidine kinase [Lacticaseibacillus kribbianus]|uniref:HAMP domain-containing sensor histidine kinase n=1 Tax=Lacticaseibacillus kribbianus TaxID=2926292 RepID=UPI001CD6D709|nr:HAMP domain-containing histidine kinase [Lacticaseibacillus kribbianus]
MVAPKGERARSHRLPLGFKWTAIVAAGIFVTFTVLSLVLVTVMRQILVEQEKNSVSDTLSAVEQRLSPVASNLSVSTVEPRVNGTNSTYAPASDGAKSTSASTSIFSDSVIQKISRADISVAVYDEQGMIVFSSHHHDEPLIEVDTTKIDMTKNSEFQGMIGSAPIVSTVTGHRIGYVQVTDRMTTFYATMRQIWTLIGALFAAALLVSLAIGFFLARNFVKPIKLITKTIDVVNEEPQSSVRIPQLRRRDELGDLVIEFNEMLDRIQRFIDQQGEFVQDVSHELRTPVAILEGHLQLLNRWGKDDPEVLDESLAASLQEVTRMKSLIQEMLDLTRADQVDVQFPNAVCDLNQIIEQVVNDFRMIHSDFVFTLDNDLAGATYIRMYRNHLEQVLIILLDNAVKYSTNRKEIHVSAADNSDGAAVAVQDFGEGISPKDRERVFNRFYRVDKARSREKGGNGLGLSIAQQLVESYHGEISVDSALGHGSSFRIDLPVITPELAEKLRAQEAAKAAADQPQLHSQL